MELDKLLDALPEKSVTNPGSVTVGSIVHDSRLVRPGDVFVALRETSGRDGHDHIGSAVENGAVAVVRKSDIDVCTCDTITEIIVPDTNLALALLAARKYDNPADNRTLIGITGTNGKTTVAHMVESILRADNRATGFIGTTGSRINSREVPSRSHHTTPYPDDLHNLLRTMVDQGSEYVVMEVSSHALALDRIAGLSYQCAVFNNLSQDHLDYHGTMEDYHKTKLALFEDHLKPGGTGILNLDDPLVSSFLKCCGDQVLTFGRNSEAQVRPTATPLIRPNGTVMTVDTPGGQIEVRIPLVGTYNESNALAAIAVGIDLGVAPEAIAVGLADVVVPGRLEPIDEGQPYRVLVDYAHTPDALQAALIALRPVTSGRLIVVFGCGGDRDPGKRPMMGAVASHKADMVIVTSDNPRSEVPEAIIDQVVEGIGSDQTACVLVNRMDAIAKAIAVARKGDTVLLAGKGNETVQHVGGQEIAFDDREVARTLLQNEFTGALLL